MHWGTKLLKIKDMTFASKLMVAAAMLLLPIIASAHQPIIMTGEDVAVTEPEISKAYYATLSGEPHIYRISETRPFELYVNVLVPDIGGQKKDVSAAIIKNGDTGIPWRSWTGLMPDGKDSSNHSAEIGIGRGPNIKIGWMPGITRSGSGAAITTANIRLP
jgi:hypothetical protein